MREVMGNAFVSGVPAPHSPSQLLRLRKGKRNSSCPCFLSEQAPTWDMLTLDPKFRPYVLRHLLDEGLICSVLEHGEREHALTACEGVLYFKVSHRFGFYMDDIEYGALVRTADGMQRSSRRNAPRSFSKMVPSHSRVCPLRALDHEQ